jgi:hypothetical protein
VSTFTAIGPAVSLDGPLPVRPPYSLLDTAGVVVSEDATRVLNGANVWGYPTDCSLLWEPCSDGTFRTKSSRSEMPLARFDSFVVYMPVACSAIGFGGDKAEELVQRAEDALDATLSAGVEQALAAGVEGSSNPFFGDVNVDDVTSGTAVSATVAFAMLEEALGAQCRLGMIHATPAVIAALQPLKLMDGPLLTANGTPVVSGMGYQGVDTPFLAEPGATEDWIFATGPPRVHLGPVVTTSIKETLDRTYNDLTFRAERYVLAYWDTAVQAAALVDWTT